jgi:hypothetical protein
MVKNDSGVVSAGSSFDALASYGSARALAVSAGDLSVVVRNEVKKVLKDNRNDVLKAVTNGLGELTERGFISANEAENLRSICGYLFGSIRGKADPEDSFLMIRRVYHQLLKDQRSSPTALAIASVAHSAFNLEKSSPLTITPETTGGGAVVGAVIGGVIGGLAGGAVGAGIGAAIGGAAGAAIGWCNETGN